MDDSHANGEGSPQNEEVDRQEGPSPGDQRVKT